MVVMEKEVADERLGVKFDRIFGTAALRHVRREIQNLQGPCPWDLICLVSVFMFRAQVSRLELLGAKRTHDWCQVSGNWDIAKAHQDGLTAMVQSNGGLRAVAASNHMAQAGVNGLIL